MEQTTVYCIQDISFMLDENTVIILFQYLCRAHHGMLAAIETMEENNFVKSEAAARKGNKM